MSYCPATGKIQHATRAEANRVRTSAERYGFKGKRRERELGVVLVVYRCDSCGTFHLGRTLNKKGMAK